MSAELQTSTDAELPAKADAGLSDMIQAFEDAQRVAKLWAAASIIPIAFQGNIPDCVVALDMAGRMGISPLTVMQSLYVVHGKPGWSAAALIGFLNQTDRFSSIRYDRFGEVGTDARGCTAWVVDRAGERIDGPPCTIAIAKGEGWFGRKGSKWPNMPELMLGYRAATWLCRLVAPEVGLGLPTRDEIIDISPTGPEVSRFERPAVALLSPNPAPVAELEPGSDVGEELPDADFGQEGNGEVAK